LPVSARKETIFDKAARFYRRHTVAILLIAAYLAMPHPAPDFFLAADLKEFYLPL